MSIDSRLERIEQGRASRKRARGAFTQTEIVARIEARLAGYRLSAEAYAGLSVGEKIAETRRQLAEVIAAWEGRDRSAFSVNSDRMHTLHCRYLEIDIEALQNSALDIEEARTQADEACRGRPPSVAPIIERNPVVAIIGVPSAQGNQRKPKFDKLADYSGTPQPQIWEPSFT